MPIQIVYRLVTDALASLVKLSIEHWNMIPRVFRYPGSEGAKLVLVGPKEGGPVKYMIWALTLAIEYMARSNSFRDYIFHFRNGRQHVGFVQFEFSTGGTTDTNSEETAVNTTATEPSDRDAVHFQILDYPAIKCSFPGLPPGPTVRPLSIRDAMMPLIGALTDMAPHDLNQQITSPDVSSVWQPYNGRFELAPVLPPGADVPAWFTHLFVWHLVIFLVGDVLKTPPRMSQYQIICLCHEVFCAHGGLTSIPGMTEPGGNHSTA